MKFLSTSRTALVLALAAAGFAAHAKSPAQWQALTAPLQVTLEQAIDKATQAVPGKVLEIELDDGDGAGVRYEAEVLTSTQERVEVWVDGATGMARTHKHKGQAKDKHVQRLQAAKLSVQQAIAAATAHTAGKAIKAELDEHRGSPVYKVDVLQADHTVMEIELDANDSKVLRAKLD